MIVDDWPCFVISGSASRLAAFHERLPLPWPWSRPVYYRAVWGLHTGAPAAFGGPPGAWGCWRTHVRIWEDVFSQVLPGAIVLEDDCTFAGRGDAWAAAAAEFVAALPADWDLAYLGGQHLHPPLQLAPGLQKGVDVNRTHAYLVRSTPRTQAAYWRLCGQAADVSDIGWSWEIPASPSTWWRIVPTRVPVAHAAFRRQPPTDCNSGVARLQVCVSEMTHMCPLAASQRVPAIISGVCRFSHEDHDSSFGWHEMRLKKIGT